MADLLVDAPDEVGSGPLIVRLSAREPLTQGIQYLVLLIYFEAGNASNGKHHFCCSKSIIYSSEIQIIIEFMNYLQFAAIWICLNNE